MGEGLEGERLDGKVERSYRVDDQEFAIDYALH